MLPNKGQGEFSTKWNEYNLVIFMLVHLRRAPLLPRAPPHEVGGHPWLDPHECKKGRPADYEAVVRGPIGLWAPTKNTRATKKGPMARVKRSARRPGWAPGFYAL